MSEWQDIETAPQDGTRVLVQCADGIIAAKKLATYLGWHSVPGRFLIKPTHWMPLPAPPEVQL